MFQMTGNQVFQRIQFLEKSFLDCYETLQWREFECERIAQEYIAMKKENSQLKKEIDRLQKRQTSVYQFFTNTIKKETKS